MAELVDALDSKSSDFGRVGSIPTLSTDKSSKDKNESEFLKGTRFFWIKQGVFPLMVFKATLWETMIVGR